MSKIPILPQLKKTLEYAKSFTAKLFSEFAATTADAIDEIHSRIDEIELTPGPAGPTGPAGPQGPQGAGNSVSVTIPSSGWVSDTSVSAYPYRYDISASGITTKDRAVVTISAAAMATAIACGMCTTNETLSDVIRLRAKQPPSSSMSAEYWIEKGQ